MCTTAKSSGETTMDSHWLRPNSLKDFIANSIVGQLSAYNMS